MERSLTKKNMAINTQFTVAIHILSFLAIHDKPQTSKVIADSVNTNPVVVRRIIGLLQRAGLVETTMGADGGSRLCVDPKTISLLDIFNATDQGRVLNLHNRDPKPDCICGGQIKGILSPIYDRAQSALESELSGTTISDLVSEMLAHK